MASSSATQRAQRWALLRSSPLVCDRTRVRFHRLRVEELSGEFLVRRVDTDSTISTGEAGARCIELLLRGETMGGVREAVGRVYGCSPGEVDVMPLLDCMVEADFIESVDGYPVSASRHRSLAAVRLMALASLPAPLITWAARTLPLAILLRLAHARRRPRDRRIVGLIAAHMRALPGLGVSAHDAHRLARANCDALSAQYMDRILLATMHPHRLHRWLTGHVRVVGLGHLDEAMARGRGALLCAFHTGSYGLTPFVLAALGRGVTVLTGMDETGDQSLARRFGESRDAGHLYDIEGVGRSAAARPLLRALGGGRAVMLLCDAVPSPGGRWQEVEFLGGRVQAASGPDWLVEQSGAVPLPVITRCVGRWRHEVVIEPPLTPAGRGQGQVVAGLYRVLERHVRADPALWLKWKDLPAYAPGLSAPVSSRGKAP